MGFLAASTAAFAGMALLGATTGGSEAVGAVGWYVLAVFLGVLGFVDLLGWRVFALRRQTPDVLLGRLTPGWAGLVWGLDTGSVVSTYRVSAASWGALALAWSGLMPAWVGAVYGCAFVLPVLVLSWVNGFVTGASSPLRRSRTLRRLAEMNQQDLERNVYSRRERVRRLAGGLMTLTAIAMALQAGL